MLVALLALKFVLIFWLARQFGNDKPTALRSALALAPAGEFGFVLLSLAGREGGAGPAARSRWCSPGALLSMLATPVLLAQLGAHRPLLRARASGRSAPWRCTSSR